MRRLLLHLAAVVGISAVLLGLTATGWSQALTQAAYVLRNDSLHMDRIRHFKPIEDPMLSGVERNARTLPRRSHTQSEIYVIDTAVIRSLGYGGLNYYPADTIRHVYAFNKTGKRTSDVTQTLVGEVWTNYSRWTAAYDENDRMVSLLLEQWNDGQWSGYDRWSYTYDENGDTLSKVEEVWRDTWENSMRLTYTYDIARHMLAELEELWTYGKWEGARRLTYTYDADGNQLSSLIEGKELGTQWRNIMRVLRTFDVNGNMLTELSAWRVNNQWALGGLSTCSYDSAGHRTAALVQTWSDSQWTNSVLYTYSYDEGGALVSEVYDRWSNGEWSHSYRNTYAYGANQRLISHQNDDWDSDHWVPWHRWTYAYDGNGNQISRLEEEWLGAFVYDLLQSWTYDTERNLTAVWNYDWYHSSWVPAEVNWAERFTVYDSAGNIYSYNHFYNLTLTHRAIVTGLDSEDGMSVATYKLWQNYPNPFNPNTTIKYDLPKSSEVRLSVYDIIGREVSTLVNEMKDAGLYEVRFDASGLSSGVYFYRLTAGNYIATKKLVLVR